MKSTGFREQALMKKTWAALVLAAFSCLLSEGCRQSASIPVESLEITPLLDLGSLNPKYQIISPLFQGIALDQREHIFFIDHGNHRILEFDLKGVLISEIGGIGQGDDALFSPIAIAIENNSLYVLNDGGRQVKIFSLDGKYQFSFAIDNAWTSHSLLVDGDSILVNVIDKYRQILNDGMLISIYDQTGQLINKIGPIIQCNSFAGYRGFNSIRISAHDDRVYYAFNYQPLISWCDRDGSQNGTMDLRNLDIYGVEAIVKRTETSEYDTPETKKEDSDLSLTMMGYCSGFGVDETGCFYYAVNAFPSDSQDDLDDYILYFNDKHKLMKKIQLKIEGETVFARNLLIHHSRGRYAVGTVKEKILLLKF